MNLDWRLVQHNWNENPPWMLDIYWLKYFRNYHSILYNFCISDSPNKRDLSWKSFARASRWKRTSSRRKDLLDWPETDSIVDTIYVFKFDQIYISGLKQIQSLTHSMFLNLINWAFGTLSIARNLFARNQFFQHFSA